MLFIGAVNLNAQWEKVANYNVGVGRLAVHGSTLFLYGIQGSLFVYRSTDNGITWTNIASKFPDKYLISIHGHGSYVFASGIGFFYYSTDDGVTWNVKSRTGFTGSIVNRLISDGTTLYALSDGARVFKSTDNGSSWSEIKVNHVNAIAAGNDFTASGNKMVFCMGSRSFISNDGGAKWIFSNPSSYVAAVHAFKGNIYGSGFGMYKLVSDTVWQSITSGFLAGIGITASTRSTVSVGNKIFTYYSDVITQSGKIFASDNNGNNWYEVGNNLPPTPASSLIDLLAATPEYLFYYNSNTTSVYRYPIQAATAIENNDVIIPQEFSLSQNYPNPFNPSTKISFALPSSSNVSLKVFNTIGQEVSELVNENLEQGNYSVDFNASKLSSGVYFYKLSTSNFVQIKKMLLMK